MTDIIRHIKDQIEDVTKKALAEMDIQGKDSDAFKQALEGEIEIEIPKEKAHGDFSINTAMKLTKILRTSPVNIANALTAAMNFEGTYIEKCEIANFWKKGVHKNCGVSCVELVDGEYQLLWENKIYY